MEAKTSAWLESTREVKQISFTFHAHGKLSAANPDTVNVEDVKVFMIGTAKEFQGPATGS